MELEKGELGHQCTDCMVGQGRDCRCAFVNPVPTVGTLAALALLFVLAALVFGIGLGQLIAWATL